MAAGVRILAPGEPASATARTYGRVEVTVDTALPVIAPRRRVTLPTRPAFAVLSIAGPLAGPDVVRLGFHRVVPPRTLEALEALGIVDARPDGQDGLIVALPPDVARESLRAIDNLRELVDYVPRVWGEPSSARPQPLLPTPTLRAASRGVLRTLSAIRDLVSPERAASEAATTTVVPFVLVVELLTPAMAEGLRARLVAAGLSASRHGDRVLVSTARLIAGRALDAASVQRWCALVPGVLSVSRRPIARATSTEAARIVWSAAPPRDAGSNEVIALTDSGVGEGDLDALPDAIRGRVRAVKSFAIPPLYNDAIDNPGADDGPADRSGHGTHNVGTLVGQGDDVAGCAQGASVYVQAVQQRALWRGPWRDLEPTALYGLPESLDVLHEDAYAQGARVHVHPWGGGAEREYDSHALEIDRFVHAHRDYVIVVSAGNESARVGPGGAPRLGNVASIATAKNAIVVGASENLRPDRHEAYFTLSQNFAPYGAMNTAMADDAEQVAFFSCRGPTADQRVKPDLVAPGTWILSVASPLAAAPRGWSAPAPTGLRFMGGTSMSASIVGAAAASVRSALRAKGVSSPSAALIKALLLHGATPTRAAPTVDHGFGRLSLDPLLRDLASGAVVFLDESDERALRTGDARTVELAIDGTSPSLRATLVYTDAPGPTLNNNLNLVVRAPSGAARYGNAADGEDEPDARNNAERVFIDSCAEGPWLIEVIAVSVSSAPQRYALVFQRSP